ncbi:histidine kinase dimerization/phosphoacceptor domain-containing protein [Curtobacterium sp. MCJR17_043]|uniref:histidine kinase dimerization/phosphoacceptor domain-containing protein n=1 Tax=Curtobacterium sp. MCJR17_043 TaxID=2175660 RepID=UPI0024E02113|nr:histidine kinase dimerization/phosphoacceptor domain-containing protein [Curtobacterium sp. MCJR17_043]WIB34845.1 histidine kinase dimerization/phosphoacceptor domain-containing protein [Curtobacterium sp. MCJR17_043]
MELAGALVVLVVLLYAVTALATAHDLVARALLGDRTGELEHRVEELTDSRRALLDGFDAERRRIERDLHDGAQQQLTILSMNIGLLAVDLDAAERDGRDLGTLRQALDRISGNVDDAVDALRATIRGIHPPRPRRPRSRRRRRRTRRALPRWPCAWPSTCRSDRPHGSRPRPTSS